MISFRTCKKCEKLFEDVFSTGICSICVGKFGRDREFRRKLSKVRNFIKDLELEGVVLTVKLVAQGTELEQDEIWMFIRLGEIDTVAFDDPKVREFKLRVVRRREKEIKDEHRGLADDFQRVTKGFHSKTDKER